MAESKVKIEKLKKDKEKIVGKLIKALELEEAAKFPMKDELLQPYLAELQFKDKDKKQIPLKPIPSPILKLETLIDPDSVADALTVWEFIHVFRSSLYHS